MEGVATSFIGVESRISRPAVHAYSVVHHKTQFGNAMFDRYVYMVTLTECLKAVNTMQNLF